VIHTLKKINNIKASYCIHFEKVKVPRMSWYTCLGCKSLTGSPSLVLMMPIVPTVIIPHPSTEILDFQLTTRIPNIYTSFSVALSLFLVHLSLSKCSTICICGDHFCRKPSWGSSRNSKHKFLCSRVTIYKDQHLLANWARATTMLAVQKRASSYQLWNLDHVCAFFGFPSNA